MKLPHPTAAVLGIALVGFVVPTPTRSIVHRDAETVPAILEECGDNDVPAAIVISAGFDAHVADDMSMVSLTDADYRWVTEQIVAVAAGSASGRTEPTTPTSAIGLLVIQVLLPVSR